MSGHRELTCLDVAALLAEQFHQKGQQTLALEVGEEPTEILDMIALNRPFSKKILRHLGLKRIVTFVPVTSK